ncbi:MAG: agmatine deiminase family protein [Pseudomonadota bacterium]
MNAAALPGPDSQCILTDDSLSPGDDCPPRARIYEHADRNLGHRLRGDWEPPNALLLAYSEQWADSLADLVAIAQDQTRVFLLANPAKNTSLQIQTWILRSGLGNGKVSLLWIGHDTPWIRDYGPLEIVRRDGDHSWLDADYSDSRPADDAIPSVLASRVGVPVEPLPFHLAGGAIISNGLGLCATTIEYCRENNIDFDDPAIMDPLLETLGCQLLALLPALKDEKARHIDMFAQFLAADVVAVADVRTTDSHEDAERMDEAARGLKEAAARLGSDLRVARVPLPYLGEGKYRTYVNGLRLRTSFVAPSYRDVPDDIEASAYRALADTLSGIEVVVVPADNVIRLLGSLHCISLGLTFPENRTEPTAEKEQVTELLLTAASAEEAVVAIQVDEQAALDCSVPKDLLHE